MPAPDNEDAMEDVRPYLNADCLALVFQYLNCYELMTVSTICKLWNKVRSFVLRTRSHIDISCLGRNGISARRLMTILRQTDGNLKSLDLCDTFNNHMAYMEITDDIAKAIIYHCPNLRKLKVGNNFQLTSLPLFFRNMPNLTDVCFEECDEDMAYETIHTILTSCKSLQILTIKVSKLLLLDTYNWENFKYFPHSSLKHLEVEFHDVDVETESVLEGILQGCTELESLEVGVADSIWSIVFNKPMAFLKKLVMRKLEHALQGPGVPLDLHDSLEMTPNLTHLSLYGNILGNNFNRIASSCPSLQVLDVSFCSFGKRGIASFLPSLKGLNLIQLNCKNTSLNNIHVVKLIKQLPQLIRLVFDFCDNVDEELIPLLNEESELKERKLQAVQLTSNLPHEKSINIVNSKIDVWFGSLAFIVE